MLVEAADPLDGTARNHAREREPQAGTLDEERAVDRARAFTLAADDPERSQRLVGDDVAGVRRRGAVADHREGRQLALHLLRHPGVVCIEKGDYFPLRLLDAPIACR